jgi:SAM-dependent methyltransferase
MDHNYYAEYYQYERSHWWFTARESILISFIKKIRKNNLPTADLKILNVGCSTGRSSEYLAQFGTVTSLEYDAYCCEFTREKTGLEIIHGSVTELAFENEKFDLVCAFDVIEHVEDDALAISEMKRVLKTGGVLLLTVPAFMDLWSHHDEINHHFRRYTMSELKQYFLEKPENIIFKSYFNTLLFIPIYSFRKMSNWFRFGKKRQGAGSDFESFNPGFVNSILNFMFKSEKNILSNFIKLPFGVSILFCWTKTN